MWFASDFYNLYPYSKPPEELSNSMGACCESVLFQIFTDTNAPSVSKSLKTYVLNLKTP